MMRKALRNMDLRAHFFSGHLLLYFVSTLLFSRLFHVIFYWWLPGKSSFSADHPILSFFTMSDFYFTVTWAIFGFVLVLLWSLKGREQEERLKAYDAVALSFLFAAVVGFIGAFLGWQIYGVVSYSGLGVDYSLTNPRLGEFPRFPLWVVYAIITGVIFSFCYMFRKAHTQHGLTAFFAAGLFGLMILIGDFWNPASSDNLSSAFGYVHRFRLISMSQIMAGVLLIWALRNLIIELKIPVHKSIEDTLRISPKKKTKSTKKKKPTKKKK